MIYFIIYLLGFIAGLVFIGYKSATEDEAFIELVPIVFLWPIVLPLCMFIMYGSYLGNKKELAKRNES